MISRWYLTGFRVDPESKNQCLYNKRRGNRQKKATWRWRWEALLHVFSRDKLISPNMFSWQRQRYKSTNRNMQILLRAKNGTDPLTFLFCSGHNKPKTWTGIPHSFSQSKFKVPWKSLWIQDSLKQANNAIDHTWLQSIPTFSVVFQDIFFLQTLSYSFSSLKSLINGLPLGSALKSLFFSLYSLSFLIQFRRPQIMT